MFLYVLDTVAMLPFIERIRSPSFTVPRLSLASRFGIVNFKGNQFSEPDVLHLTFLHWFAQYKVSANLFFNHQQMYCCAAMPENPFGIVRAQAWTEVISKQRERENHQKTHHVRSQNQSPLMSHLRSHPGQGWTLVWITRWKLHYKLRQSSLLESALVWKESREQLHI
jgi:hypothetical protein